MTERKASLRRLLVWCFSVIGAALVGVALVDVHQARRHTREIVPLMLASQEMVLDVDDLSERRLRILLAVEDPNFYGHQGVDLRTPGAGVTTITQGLAKGLYFRRFKPGIAKIRQTILALAALDPLVSKTDQLRLFINTCPLGTRQGQAVRGLASAAQAYFGKSFDLLMDEEYMALIAMYMAPSTFHVLRHPDRNAERVRRIRRLVDGEYVPKGLLDLTYGRVSDDIRRELPPLSYLERYYRE